MVEFFIAGAQALSLAALIYGAYFVLVTISFVLVAREGIEGVVVRDDQHLVETAQALELAESFRPDLVVLDVMLPALDTLVSDDGNTITVENFPVAPALSEEHRAMIAAATASSPPSRPPRRQ